MITATSVRTWELDRTPDLIDLVSAARDNGHEVLLIERPMPDAVSVAALGKAFDLVAARGGVALEDATGKTIDFESGGNRLTAASRLWRRFCDSVAWRRVRCPRRSRLSRACRCTACAGTSRRTATVRRRPDRRC